MPGQRWYEGTFSRKMFCRGNSIQFARCVVGNSVGGTALMESQVKQESQLIQEIVNVLSCEKTVRGERLIVTETGHLGHVNGLKNIAQFLVN